MRILADTRILLWWLADGPALPHRHREALMDPTNAVLFSAVSVAEVAIKTSLGKLDAPDAIAEALTEDGLIALDFTAAHAALLRDLPWHHRDPFDRMLVAQAMHEGLVLATVDARIPDYHVPVL